MVHGNLFTGRWKGAIKQKTESKHKIANINDSECLRPYHVENASSRPITEAKQRRAQLVLGWVTAWEYWVL